MKVIAATAPGYVVIGNDMLMVTIATAWSARHQEHLGHNECQVLMAIAEEAAL